MRAFAKVNLFLEVLGKLPNGYHEIETIYQEISLADTVKVSLLKNAQKITVNCSNPKIPSGAKNIASKAAQAFLTASKSRYGANIEIEKNIPVGAGLGGGSSDAAAVLKILNKAHKNRNNNPVNLPEIAGKLGADVPFFLYGGICAGHGIGADIKPLNLKNRFWAVLVYPCIKILTRTVYGLLPDNVTLTERQRINKIKSLLEAGTPPRIWVRRLYNRLEDVVLARYDKVAEVKKALEQAGCLGTLLSGSGSCVYGVVETYHEAKKVLNHLTPNPWLKWIVKSVERAA